MQKLPALMSSKMGRLLLAGINAACVLGPVEGAWYWGVVSGELRSDPGREMHTE